MKSKPKSLKLLLSRKQASPAKRLMAKLQEMGFGAVMGMKSGGSPSTHIHPYQPKQTPEAEEASDTVAPKPPKGQVAYKETSRWRRKL